MYILSVHEINQITSGQPFFKIAIRGSLDTIPTEPSNRLLTNLKCVRAKKVDESVDHRMVLADVPL